MGSSSSYMMMSSDGRNAKEDLTRQLADEKKNSAAAKRDADKLAGQVDDLNQRVAVWFGLPYFTYHWYGF